MKNLKGILVLIIVTSVFGCDKQGIQEVYECECEVKQCFFCFKFTETITIYSDNEFSADYECGEHQSELSEGVNTWGSVNCNLIKLE